MEIQSLKLFVTDADLAEMAQQHIPANDNIEDLQARFSPEGMLLQGQYATGFGFKVAFETLWKLTAAGPQLHVSLDTIKVAGLPGNMLRSVLMRMVRDAVEQQPGVNVVEDQIQIDVPAVARAHKGNVRINFTSVQMSIGVVVIEAG